MLPLADRFVHVDVLVDQAVSTGLVRIPRRPGPAPACTDAEVLTIALVRHLLGRPSEAGFLAEVRRDWSCLFPRLPAQSEFNRRVRWLWGAFELLRRHRAAHRGWLSAPVRAARRQHHPRAPRCLLGGQTRPAKPRSSSSPAGATPPSSRPSATTRSSTAAGTMPQARTSRLPRSVRTASRKP